VIGPSNWFLKLTNFLLADAGAFDAQIDQAIETDFDKVSL
jgi:hypothetical protein